MFLDEDSFPEKGDFGGGCCSRRNRGWRGGCNFAVRDVGNVRCILTSMQLHRTDVDNVRG
jgi:hypothetical protein